MLIFFKCAVIQTDIQSNAEATVNGLRAANRKKRLCLPSGAWRSLLPARAPSVAGSSPSVCGGDCVGLPAPENPQPGDRLNSSLNVAERRRIKGVRRCSIQT